jgi:hypothetical protein
LKKKLEKMYGSPDFDCPIHQYKNSKNSQSEGLGASIKKILIILIMFVMARGHVQKPWSLTLMDQQIEMIAIFNTPWDPSKSGN